MKESGFSQNPEDPKQKGKKGFGGMSPEKQKTIREKAIASRLARGTTYKFTSEDHQKAGEVRKANNNQRRAKGEPIRGGFASMSDEERLEAQKRGGRNKQKNRKKTT
jgi:hypothetical protein